MKINYEADKIIHNPIFLTLDANNNKEIEIPDCNKIKTLYDPQGVFKKIILNNNLATCTIGNNTGYHTVIAEVETGSCKQWRILHLKVENKFQEAIEAAKNPSVLAMKGTIWKPFDFSKQYNADIRNIYKQDICRHVQTLSLSESERTVTLHGLFLIGNQKCRKYDWTA